VLLGCRLDPGGNLGAAARRRVSRAVAAWHENPESIILVSGGRRWWGVAEARALRDALATDHGVPRRCIVAEWCSLTTAENARYSAELLAVLGLRRVAVVTCDWHLPRALASFRAAGVPAVGLEAVTPPVSRSRHAWRAARERGAEVLDRWATWGVRQS
jgi:uncharacterized SAM-binding protein YcdF (DUF218 family)